MNYCRATSNHYKAVPVCVDEYTEAEGVIYIN